jgi:hypothetical protein
LGESFTDLGKPYRDDNQNNTYEIGIDQAIDSVGTGSGACPQTDYSLKNSVLLTCNGVRDSTAIVRARATLYLAPSNLTLAEFGSSSGSLTLELYSLIDITGVKYRAPSGTTVVAAVVPSTGSTTTCVISLNTFDIISFAGNATTPTRHTISFTPSACSGQLVEVKVTTPKGVVSTSTFVL